MKKRLAALGVLIVLAGCGGLHEVKHEVRNEGGHEFLCSWTENKISGNREDPQCVLIP